MMQAIPKDGALDSTLAVLREGYRFGPQRFQRLGTDMFRTRLFGRRAYFVRGADAARMFYTPDRFERVMPKPMLKLLQDVGSVATLQGKAHRQRKAMFMSLMTPEAVAEAGRRAADALRARIPDWEKRDRVVLHDEVVQVLFRAACSWADIPVQDDEADRLAADTGATLAGTGSLGPRNWIAQRRRRHLERFLKRAVEDIRNGTRTPRPNSAAAVIALHREPDGNLLTAENAAVELCNIVRPIVAIARFMTFAAMALHQHPDSRDKVASDPAWRTAFVQEVRRIQPFFPAVFGKATEDFSWRGMEFHAGDRFVIDLFGTDHDGRIWSDPGVFRPERFLDWKGDPYTMVPQGGGDFAVNHRCAGEWLTIAVMEAMVEVLTKEVRYTVPPQDLSVDLQEMPALPESGFVITDVRRAS